MALGTDQMAGKIRLIHCEQQRTGYRAQLMGPYGCIEIRDLVWITDREDILECYYWESWAVLNGAYHCCFSIPGKVLLIP